MFAWLRRFPCSKDPFNLKTNKTRNKYWTKTTDTAWIRTMIKSITKPWTRIKKRTRTMSRIWIWARNGKKAKYWKRIMTKT